MFSMTVRAFVDLKVEGVVVLCVFCICQGGPHDTRALKSFYEFLRAQLCCRVHAFVLQFIGVQFAPS
jgi:hypothetical protein